MRVQQSLPGVRLRTVDCNEVPAVLATPPPPSVDTVRLSDDVTTTKWDEAQSSLRPEEMPDDARR